MTCSENADTYITSGEKYPQRTNKRHLSEDQAATLLQPFDILCTVREPMSFNVTVTPHLSYVTYETLRAFYTDTLEALVAYVDRAPIRVANPGALPHPKQRK